MTKNPPQAGKKSQNNEHATSPTQNRTIRRTLPTLSSRASRHSSKNPPRKRPPANRNRQRRKKLRPRKPTDRRRTVPPHRRNFESRRNRSSSILNRPSSQHQQLRTLGRPHESVPSTLRKNLYRFRHRQSLLRRRRLQTRNRNRQTRTPSLSDGNPRIDHAKRRGLGNPRPLSHSRTPQRLRPPKPPSAHQ